MKYRKKPVVIEAVQFDGENFQEILEFAKGKSMWWINHPSHGMVITTLEGDMKASKGDYIIKGVKGEFYPCKPDIFELIYALVE